MVEKRMANISAAFAKSVKRWGMTIAHSFVRTSGILAAALTLAGVSLVSKPADATPKKTDVMDRRVAAVRVALIEKLSKQGSQSLDVPTLTQAEIELAQWGNWGNWGNWNNWVDWNNWNNWTNWANAWTNFVNV
jgi:hypothetical protein